MRGERYAGIGVRREAERDCVPLCIEAAELKQYGSILHFPLVVTNAEPRRNQG